jgi:hypothetical protein
MKPINRIRGMEINTKLVGALFTDTIGDRLSVFCLYRNGEALQFDLPAEGNIASVDEMFRQFDLFKKGNSVVVEQLVRSRVYVEEPKGIWMYVLLATEGSRCPHIDEKLHDLPWQCVWSGRGTEVLKLERGRRDYCFAVRSPIIEAQLKSTLRETNALLHPRMWLPPKRLALKAAAGGLAGVLVIIGLVAGFRHVRNGGGAKPTVVSARPLTPSAVLPGAPTNYFLLANRELSGPFPLEKILEREKTGQLPADALVRAEQSADWQKLDLLTGLKLK